jgi:hypothetical protein
LKPGRRICKEIGDGSGLFQLLGIEHMDLAGCEGFGPVLERKSFGTIEEANGHGTISRVFAPSRRLADIATVAAASRGLSSAAFIARTGNGIIASDCLSPSFVKIVNLHKIGNFLIDATRYTHYDPPNRYSKEVEVPV